MTLHVCIFDCRLEVAMSNIPGDSMTGVTRAQLNSVIMNYLITGTYYFVTGISYYLQLNM